MSKAETRDESFELYDLRVEVVCPPGERIMCGAKEGDHFSLQGEMLYLPPGQGFSIYSLCKYNIFPCEVETHDTTDISPAAVMPLLAAKQRVTSPNDWMTTDAEVACPDPHCKSRLRITRTGVRKFNHSEVTVVPLSQANDRDA